METISKQRNDFVDIIRGIAILFVVLGHTMTGCTVDSENSFLFNVIWSLQMPLFILISGYVTRYSRPITNGFSLLKFIARRSLAYLLPWFVWTFVVRGIVFRESNYFNLSWLLWHMDSGYWFLVTIWTISMVFGICSYLSGRIAKESKIKLIVLTFVFYVICMSLLFAVGMLLGLSFFAIKLTLYYMPFYFAGYLYGQFRDSLFNWDTKRIAFSIITVFSVFTWFFILTRYNIYRLEDSGLSIVLRTVTSFAGCVAFSSAVKGLFDKSHLNLFKRAFKWCGIHSLEIYLIHNLLLVPLKQTAPLAASSISGVGLVFVNYSITVFLSVLIVSMLTSNNLMKTILFGYKK